MPPIKITGAHKHATLGVFHYDGEYTARMVESIVVVDWNVTAIGAGVGVELTGGNLEIDQGGLDAAHHVVEVEICEEIDRLPG